MLYNLVILDTEPLCTAGANPLPSEPARMTGLSGTFLNTRDSFLCSTNLTKWHYCYYTQAVTQPELSMVVAIWSLDTSTNSYVVSHGSIRNITQNHTATLAKLFCVEEALKESDYVQVNKGDVIGVVLASNNAIPVLGSATSSSDMLGKSQYDYPQNISLNSLSSFSGFLHLYASTSG